MFDVKFYTLSKRNNSTKQPFSIEETNFECDIRNISNILNPSIELKHQNPTNFNYCYIQAFSRYYLISNWTWNQGLWIASCTIDVLATYKTQIGNSTKFVMRSYSQRNVNLIDLFAPLMATNSIQEQSLFPYSNSQISMNDGVWVVGIVGNNGSGQTMYQMDVSNFQTLLSSLLTTADGYDWGDLTQGVINSLMNPTQYITSCRWFPKSFIHGAAETIKCGLWNSNATGYPIIPMNDVSYASISRAFVINKHPQENEKGAYMNLKPFSQATFDLGVFGIVDVDTTLLFDASYIYLKIDVDAYSGIGTIRGYAENDTHDYKRLLFKRQTMFGVDIPLSSNNSNIVSPIIETLTSSVKSDNDGNVQIGVDFGSIGNVVSAIQGSINTMGSASSVLEHLQKIRFVQIFRNATPIDYLNVGYPLMQSKQLNTLSGYILCRDGNIELSCTDFEREKIRQYLEKGFYYE